MQSLGDFLGFNPHCHILATDGCFYGDGGMFRVAPPLELKKLETIFRHKVLRLTRARPPPKAHTPPGEHDGVVSQYADGDLQLQTHTDTIYGDPESVA